MAEASLRGMHRRRSESLGFHIVEELRIAKAVVGSVAL